MLEISAKDVELFNGNLLEMIMTTNFWGSCFLYYLLYLGN